MTAVESAAVVLLTVAAVLIYGLWIPLAVIL